MMRIAAPTWQNDISPVLDTATLLLVSDTGRADDPGWQELRMHAETIPAKAAFIAIHADLLICGGISRAFEIELGERGCRVIPWVMGNAREIMREFMAGHPPGPSCRMPGCRKHRGCRRGHGDRRYNK